MKKNLHLSFAGFEFYSSRKNNDYLKKQIKSFLRNFFFQRYSKTYKPTLVEYFGCVYKLGLPQKLKQEINSLIIVVRV